MLHFSSSCLSTTMYSNREVDSIKGKKSGGIFCLGCVYDGRAINFTQSVLGDEILSPKCATEHWFGSLKREHVTFQTY